LKLEIQKCPDTWPFLESVELVLKEPKEFHMRPSVDKNPVPKEKMGKNDEKTKIRTRKILK
jgi:hypothetical protein